MICFNRPVTTTHNQAKQAIDRLQQTLASILTTERPRHLRDRLIVVYMQRIKREEQVLLKPSRLVFPTFMWMNIGENQIGLSLAGFRCNIPALARRYGVEVETAGNALHYKNWLGSHWDL